MLTGRNLDLRLEADRDELFEVLESQRIELGPDAIDFAVSKLTEDWLVLFCSSWVTVPVSLKGKFSIPLSNWAETLRSLFAMRHLKGLDEQIRRLCIPSHEALDTELVVRIAGKYFQAGFSVEFEPNGERCSDLLIESTNFRSYLEVKRENQLDHRRHTSVMRASSAVMQSTAPELRGWLEGRNLRIEVRFSRSFSGSIAPKIVKEIRAGLQLSSIGIEQQLSSVRGSQYILLECKSPPFYEKGIISSQIIFKESDKPVQLVRENMPVLVVFDRLPNLRAMKQRLNKASKQLCNDASKDFNAQGFIVLEMSHGELAKDAVVQQFPILPSICLGVVIRSDSSYLVPRGGLSANDAKVLMIAGPP